MGVLILSRLHLQRQINLAGQQIPTTFPEQIDGHPSKTIRENARAKETSNRGICMVRECALRVCRSGGICPALKVPAAPDSYRITDRGWLVRKGFVFARPLLTSPSTINNQNAYHATVFIAALVASHESRPEDTKTTPVSQNPRRGATSKPIRGPKSYRVMLTL
jgi:hypothetical protein